MKPTSDEFEPRRDGWFEHKGTWDEVSVGTVIADPKYRTKRWEIVEQAHGMQVEFGHTLWMRAREQTTGEEFTVRPHNKTFPATILTRDPADRQTAPPTEPSDAAAIMLLVEQLGAVHLASRDNTTGEITCPNYAMGHNHLDEVGGGALGRGEIEHLRFAHGLDTTAVEALGWEERMLEVSKAHARAHDPKHDFGKDGFPHRHVPEDLTIFTGIRR